MRIAKNKTLEDKVEKNNEKQKEEPEMQIDDDSDDFK